MEFSFKKKKKETGEIAPIFKMIVFLLLIWKNLKHIT